MLKSSNGKNPGDLIAQIAAIRTGVWFTDLSNISALLFDALPEINWVGFYLNHQGKLWLGPFQGKAACTFIEFDRGVCGKAAAQRKTLVVPNVHEFSDHIVCDARSCSEVVVPLTLDSRLFGVMDVDSSVLDRFSTEDVRMLEQVGVLAAQALEGSPFGLN